MAMLKKDIRYFSEPGARDRALRHSERYNTTYYLFTEARGWNTTWKRENIALWGGILRETYRKGQLIPNPE